MPQTRSQAASAATGDLLAHARSCDAYTVLKGWDHWLITGPDFVVMRELRPDEYLLQDRKAIAPYWFAERLQNEVSTAAFLAAHTSIPVLRSRLYTENDLLHLETERVKDGVALHDIITSSGKQVRQDAVRAVDEQMKETILPQLAAIKSNRIGGVDINIPVVPPYRVFQKDRRSWKRITSETDEFVLCHNHLNEQNIIVDPATYKILAIVGWECAGYFPSYFEIPFWLDSVNDNLPESTDRELAFFGLAQADLQDDSTVS